MPAQHFVPKLANAINASPRTQANALETLAISGIEPVEADWRPHAAAALLIGAQLAGEKHSQIQVANAAGVPEEAVAKQFAILAQRMKALR